MGIIGEVAAGYRLAPVLTHAIRVRRLYRRALKLTESWACDRVRGAATSGGEPGGRAPLPRQPPSPRAPARLLHAAPFAGVVAARC